MVLRSKRLTSELGGSAEQSSSGPLPLRPNRRASLTGEGSFSRELPRRQCPICLELFPGDFRVCPRDAVELVEPDPSAEAEDPLLGAVLNDAYQIVQAVGEGGMGTVYEARHTRLVNRVYAIKVMHAHLVTNTELVERFQKEAETTCLVGHHNVVQVFDVDGTPEGIPYIVSEYLDGEDLGALLDRLGSLDEGNAARIMVQICRALEAAHHVGVVHRDMKPENIYVVGSLEAPFAKLLDFGIARVEDPARAMHTRTGIIMGTPAYMAPEQAKGAKVDHRADIYSVGAILYRILTGRPPYDHEDAAQTLSALLTEEPVRPRALSPKMSGAFELVIQRAMARDPEDRYASMADFAEELEAFDHHHREHGSTESSGLIEVGEAGAPEAVPNRNTDPQRSVNARSRESRGARPWIVLGLLLAIAWGYGVTLQSVDLASLLLTGSTLGPLELLIAAIGTGAAMLTPVILYIRRPVRNAWRNSVQALVLSRRLRGFAAAAFATLGIGALTLAVLTRFVTLQEAALPIIRLSLFGASLLIGLLTYWLTPKE
jgi:serine/threonine-protein kinase